MFGCSFSNPGMSCERTSPSRPIAQMRRVVLLPADAEEHARPKTASADAAPIRSDRWLVICWLNFSGITWLCDGSIAQPTAGNARFFQPRHDVWIFSHRLPDQ